MISQRLLSVLRCPVCVQKSGEYGTLSRNGNELACTTCGTRYALHDRYADMRPPHSLAGKETVYTDADVDLDDPDIRPPVLSAGVRQRVLRLLLRPQKSDMFLDIGCGNGKFAVWNHGAVGHIIGLDPAARFAAAACETIDLVQADARMLPFAPGTFTGAYSVDVFEHLDLSGVRAHLSEVRRVVGNNGRYFCFSNTRERSWLNRLIDPGRWLAEALHRAGLVDRTRDRLRKADHFKAVETTDALREEFRCAGLPIAKLWYLNPLFATYIETIGFSLVEAFVARSARAGSFAPSSANHGRDDAVRVSAARHSAIRLLLRVATAVLMADVTFFRHIRTGPFFLVARPTPRS